MISSGHGLHIRGASGYIDEVDEARRVVNRVASYLNNVGVEVEVFHDDKSTTQSQNLDRIVDFHNSKTRDLDVSVHFNAFETKSGPMGTECLYASQGALAGNVSDRISDASDLINRGPKKRTDLAFLNNTDEPAILIEVCFVDSRADVELYEEHFEAICVAISNAISGIPQGEDESDLIELLTIGAVTIFTSKDKSYVSFTSDLDICNDGCGPAHGDPYHQAQTAYYSGGREGGEYLNADKDKYIVVPPQVRSKVPGVVMGCKGRVTNLKTQVVKEGVVGEIGPDNKTGEAAYCLAKLLNPAIDHNCGDENPIYLYELWPGIPATVDGFTYQLQPA